jgi:hypothetical protein
MQLRKLLLAEINTTPYISKIETRKGITLWLVRGDIVRKNIDIEFTNFAHHWNIKKVPVNEIWFDRETVPGELRFFIPRAIYERQLMKDGMPYDTAIDKADQFETKLRQRKDPKGFTNPCHRRLWKRLSNGLQVWLVHGRVVRDKYDDDFTEGGHGLVYKYIPKNEVWVDDDIHKDDKPFVLYHELYERNLMEKGEQYNRAHKEASKKEQFLRNNPQQIRAALKHEGW